MGAALGRRRITGKCASAIGLTSAPELRKAAALGHDARRASQLLYAHYDLPAYVAAVHSVEADISAFDNGLSDREDLARLRACRHDRG